MEKKQLQTPDLEIKKASEELTERDLEKVVGGIGPGDDPHCPTDVVESSPDSSSF